METKSLKQVEYQNEDFKFELEFHQDVAFLHCEVSRWSPSVLRHMYEVFSTTKENLIKGGFSRMATLSPNPKFAKLFGGDTVSVLEHEDKRYEVVVWELN